MSITNLTMSYGSPLWEAQNNVCQWRPPPLGKKNPWLAGKRNTGNVFKTTKKKPYPPYPPVYQLCFPVSVPVLGGSRARISQFSWWNHNGKLIASVCMNTAQLDSAACEKTLEINEATDTYSMDWLKGKSSPETIDFPAKCGCFLSFFP